jgi:hypothetical protein
VYVVVSDVRPNELSSMYVFARVIESCALASDCGSLVGESA